MFFFVDWKYTKETRPKGVIKGVVSLESFSETTAPIGTKLRRNVY
jgi:hypothetical protein